MNGSSFGYLPNIVVVPEIRSDSQTWALSHSSVDWKGEAFVTLPDFEAVISHIVNIEDPPSLAYGTCSLIRSMDLQTLFRLHNLHDAILVKADKGVVSDDIEFYSPSLVDPSQVCPKDYVRAMVWIHIHIQCDLIVCRRSDSICLCWVRNKRESNSLALLPSLNVLLHLIIRNLYWYWPICRIKDPQTLLTIFTKWEWPKHTQFYSPSLLVLFFKFYPSPHIFLIFDLLSFCFDWEKMLR